jgi:hypothetical protein
MAQLRGPLSRSAVTTGDRAIARRMRHSTTGPGKRASVSTTAAAKITLIQGSC